MTVLIGCRNTAKGEKLLQQLAEEEGTGAGSTLDLDLADLQSVSAFATRVKRFLHGRRLKLLVQTFFLTHAFESSLLLRLTESPPFLQVM